MDPMYSAKEPTNLKYEERLHEFTPNVGKTYLAFYNDQFYPCIISGIDNDNVLVKWLNNTNSWIPKNIENFCEIDTDGNYEWDSHENKNKYSPFDNSNLPASSNVESPLSTSSKYSDCQSFPPDFTYFEGMEVEARKKINHYGERGFEWVAGIIKKSNSDGTYNIRYKNGNLEYRVNEQYIRPQEDSEIEKVVAFIEDDPWCRRKSKRLKFNDLKMCFTNVEIEKNCSYSKKTQKELIERKPRSIPRPGRHFMGQMGRSNKAHPINS